MDGIVENIEEVVLAVENQDETVALFEEVFGFKFKESWTVPVDNMRVRCARIGDTQFHVVASTSPEGLIAKFVRDRGEGIHHIAFRVSNLEEAIARLKQKGIRVIPQEPRTGSQSARYIFAHPKFMHGVLIELIERK